MLYTIIGGALPVMIDILVAKCHGIVRREEASRANDKVIGPTDAEAQYFNERNPEAQA